MLTSSRIHSLAKFKDAMILWSPAGRREVPTLSSAYWSSKMLIDEVLEWAKRWWRLKILPSRWSRICTVIHIKCMSGEERDSNQIDAEEQWCQNTVLFNIDCDLECWRSASFRISNTWITLFMPVCKSHDLCLFIDYISSCCFGFVCLCEVSLKPIATALASSCSELGFHDWPFCVWPIFLY